MNWTEDFRREARGFLEYSRLWLRNVEALFRWVFTWDKRTPRALSPHTDSSTPPPARSGDSVRQPSHGPLPPEYPSLPEPPEASLIFSQLITQSLQFLFSPIFLPPLLLQLGGKF